LSTKSENYYRLQAHLKIPTFFWTDNLHTIKGNATQRKTGSLLGLVDQQVVEPKSAYFEMQIQKNRDWDCKSKTNRHRWKICER
jgi:hypothetical protein